MDWISYFLICRWSEVISVINLLQTLQSLCLQYANGCNIEFAFLHTKIETSFVILYRNFTDCDTTVCNVSYGYRKQFQNKWRNSRTCSSETFQIHWQLLQERGKLEMTW